MRAPRLARGRGAATLLLLLATSCGDEIRHGLETPELPRSDPVGEPIEVGRGLAPSSWEADVVIKIEDLRQGTHGIVSLVVRQDVAPMPEAAGEGGRLRSTVRFAVASQSGRPGGLAGLDGVEATFEHGPHGERLDGTLVLSEGAPRDAREILGRLWLCGYAGSPSWVPPRPVRVGEAWGREELAGIDPHEALRALERMEEADVPDLGRQGGVRLERVQEEGEGRRRVVLGLATFAELEGRIRQGHRHEPMSFALRAEGMAVVDTQDGLPISWQLRQQMRVATEEHPRGALDRTLTVRGTRRPAPPRDR